MAPTAANLVINFTSNYPAGQHRVCYRIQGSGDPYTCIIVNCTPFVPPAAPPACTATIPITVDNETCDPVTYEGYIQPTCEVEGSPDGQVPFTITFTPSPACSAVQFTCNNVGVASIELAAPNFGGSGYNPASPPNVVISGGGGIGATATAVVGNQGVLGNTVSNGGAAYAPDGVYPGITCTGGTGAGATFTVTVTGGVVVSVTVTDGGTGYTIGDVLTLDPFAGGAGAQVTVNTLNTGIIQYITVTSNGSGFSSTATVTIDPSPGFGGNPAVDADAAAIMMVCAEFLAGTNCDGTNKNGGVPIPPFTLGSNFNVCYAGGTYNGVADPYGYTISESTDCCYDCARYTVTSVNGGQLIFTDCSNQRTTIVNLSAGVPYAVTCAVKGSVEVNQLTGVTIVQGVDC